MTIRIQNLRVAASGQAPPDGLHPGQLCFDLHDRTVFVGDGQNQGKRIGQTPVPTPTGLGWFEFPLDPSYFLRNPEKYSAAPVNGQVITFSDTHGKPVWTSPDGLGVSGSGVSFDPSGADLGPSYDNVQVALTYGINTADQAFTVALFAQEAAEDAQATADAVAADVGPLANLLTTDKSSIVNAINELYNLLNP